MKIGFIGQGFVGKAIADDFEKRGHDIVRYSLEPDYIKNKDLLHECDIVFVAVPTPTKGSKFVDSILFDVLKLVKPGTIVVIKSTVLPGTCERLQDAYPQIILTNSPEFLSETTASYDASFPILNIVGYAKESPAHVAAAQKVLEVLPKTDHNFLVTSIEAELFKYTHNIHGFVRIILTNLVYDLTQELDVKWENLKKIMDVDSMMSPFYNDPIHKSGRGAGGNCFIKDFAAFKQFYNEKLCGEECSGSLLSELEKKNIELLKKTNKDLHLLREVYGDILD